MFTLQSKHGQCCRIFPHKFGIGECDSAVTGKSILNVIRHYNFCGIETIQTRLIHYNFQNFRQNHA